MGIRLTLAVRYLNGRRLRAFLTTLAVVFGVLVIFGMNILVPTMKEALQSSMMAASDKVDATVTQRSGGPFPASTLDVVRSVTGVRSAQGVLSRPVNLPPNFYDHDAAKPDRVTVLNLVGVNPSDARTMHGVALKEGRYLSDSDADATVISRTLCDQLGLKLGDSLSLPTARGVTPLAIVGVLSARMGPGNEQVLVTLSEAQALLDSPGQITSVEANFAAADQAQREAAASALPERLGPAYALGTLDSASSLYAALKASQIGFSAFAVLALFMGAFIIFNTFRTIVAERRRDIGMLRAIGASRRTIVGAIVIEGLIQGVVGTAIGIILGYLLALAGTSAIAPMMGQYVHISIGAPRVEPGLLIVTIVLGIGVTLAAGLAPAFSAGRVTPMEALRPVESAASYRRTLGVSAIVGIVLIAASLVALVSKSVGTLALGAVLFMVGLVLVAPVLVRPLALVFGRVAALIFARQGTGTLAEGNLSRQPSRAAVTASTTMIALAIIVALGAMTTSMSTGFLGILKKGLGSDYIFVPQSVGVWQNNVGAQASLADRLRSIPGVGPVSTLRFAAGVAYVKPAGGKSSAGPVALSLMGIDPVTFPAVSALAFDKGTEAAYAELAKGHALIANPMFAASASLKVGDIVPLETPQGPQAYKVVAIATDFLDAKVQTAFISQADLARDFHKTEDVLIQLDLSPGADAAVTGAAVRAAGESYPQFSIVEGREYYEQMKSLVSAVFSGLYVLFAFLALPALITVLNTLAISVIERTREIGMLRAVGTTRRQVTRMVLAEALILSAIGTAFGIAAGLYLGYLLVSAISGAGFPSGIFTFPWQGTLAAVIVGLGFGALASIVPARKASELTIVQALRYE
jgi:putative ABC transport system permease protein